MLENLTLENFFIRHRFNYSHSNTQLCIFSRIRQAFHPLKLLKRKTRTNISALKFNDVPWACNNGALKNGIVYKKERRKWYAKKQRIVGDEEKKKLIARGSNDRINKLAVTGNERKSPEI